ncbi:Ribosomal protein L11 methyltransferase [Collimonas arenae]|uniref:Ribosomal protein L11 methyltransferase n=1 Tax=Collimonas arenae TaxID=279058 RepID=A0A0A1FAX6_9BURK|nr:50S ribosomal protein L11 methyltransferase [Collimonas arenae]AIY40017.1 Ribosomal protein L11 methyltransferase [Collimonas arenae]
MSWTEIVIEVALSDAETLSDALMEAGALSVSVEDADLGTPDEQPLFGEPGMEPKEAAWQRSRVVALAEVDADHAAIVSNAAAACGIAVPPYSLRPVAAQDWVRLTQSQFDPIHIGKNIWVVPSWHDAPDANGLILELDPGLAFGTGSHPTTRLCMEWLEVNVPLQKPASLLDYGCGSGILAMVAKKLDNATTVVGVDIDPHAIDAARYNSERNHCEVAYYLPEDFSSHTSLQVFDIVVANILSGPLKLMAPMLCSRIAAGGSLTLSGVLAEQANDVIAAYAQWLPLTVWAEQDGWVALSGTRK